MPASGSLAPSRFTSIGGAVVDGDQHVVAVAAVEGRVRPVFVEGPGVDIALGSLE